MQKLFLVALAFFAGLAVLVAGVRFAAPAGERSVFHAADILANPYAVIAHGGGGIDGHDYTNSREAIELSLRRGLKAVEIDLRQTRDGKFIGQHDDGKFSAAGVDDSSKLTSDELFALKLHGKYHPVSSDDLSRIFSADPTLVLVTDKTRSYGDLKRDFRFQDRIYVETFTALQYLKARLQGLAHPMLRTGTSVQWLYKAFIYAFDVRLITVKKDDVEAHENYFASLKKNGVCPLVSTVNDKDFLERYKGSICAIYSDVLDAPVSAPSVF